MSAPRSRRRRSFAWRGELPSSATSFVGRERELDDIERLGDQWLLTLVGPGGVGKTRLALAAASRRQSKSCAFVDLSEARNRVDVISVVLSARGLDVPDQVDVGLTRLTHVLGRESTLTVLDNAEHVIDAVADLVVRCRPSLARFIVTSREALGLSGEERYEVAPLAEEAATRLFEERALARSYATDFERRAVVDVISQVERMPLAIELAAARTSVMLPSEIAKHLSHSSAILKGGSRDAPRGHASADRAIEWSFRLLTEKEQRALIACAVFHDGFTAPAASAVIGLDALDALQSLREKSLLRPEIDPRAKHETRFRLYESVRSFAESRLDPSDEARARHLAYYEGLESFGDRSFGVPRKPRSRARF